MDALKANLNLEDVQFNARSVFVSFALLSISAYVYSIAYMRLMGPKAPLVGIHSIFQTRFASTWTFFKDAKSVLDEGNAKYPDQIWKFVRADTDVLIIPTKYVSEIAALPQSVSSATAAQAFNLSGGNTNMNIILKNSVHSRTVHEKVTPNLTRVSGPMQDELHFAIDLELPKSEDEWTKIKPYHNILNIVARISGRILLGLPWCRDPKWLEISIKFTETVFIAVNILRLLPVVLHRMVSLMLPSTWVGTKYLREAKKMLVPEIKRRQAIYREKGTLADEQPDMLNWMIEVASEYESTPEDLAHLEIVTALSSIHTSQMNAVHVLHDVVALPEFMEELREEIRQVIAEDGPWRQWTKKSFSKLRKMDSCMRESQRWSPPSLLSFHRIMMQDYTLSDGTLLPKGAHLAVTASANQNSITDSPEKFDPSRYYKMRQKEGENHRHQFATTEPEILNFGHGRHSCPGRFFAALEIKNILVRLLMDYDWKFPGEQVRPPNLIVHEFIFPNPDAEIMCKRRPASERLPLGD